MEGWSGEKEFPKSFSLITRWSKAISFDTKKCSSIARSSPAEKPFRWTQKNQENHRSDRGCVQSHENIRQFKVNTTTYLTFQIHGTFMFIFTLKRLKSYTKVQEKNNELFLNALYVLTRLVLDPISISFFLQWQSAKMPCKIASHHICNYTFTVFCIGCSLACSREREKWQAFHVNGLSGFLWYRVL